MIGAQLRSSKENPKTKKPKIVNSKEVNYKFTYNVTLDSYRTFYKLDLLNKNLNFVPLKVDWLVKFNSNIQVEHFYCLNSSPLFKAQRKGIAPGAISRALWCLLGT